MEMTAMEVVRHAKSDIEYVEGLEKHIAAGGIVTAKTVSDLIAMIKWNARVLVEAYSE